MATPAPGRDSNAAALTGEDVPVELDALADDDDRLDEAAGGYPHHHRQGTTAADGFLGWLGG